MRQSFLWRSSPGLLALFLTLASPLAPSFLWAQEVDPGWPRQITTKDGTITIYQPQPEDLKGNILAGRAATSVLKTGKTTPVFGVFWFEGRLDVDRDGRTAVVTNVKITRVRFPEATAEQEKMYIAVVEYVIPQWRQPISLDRLITSLAAAKEERKSTEGLKHDPPRIIVTEIASVLVLYDGEPALRDVPETKLKRVVNTPYPVIFDPGTHSYYLTNTTWWYSAPDPMGPWKVGATPPPEVAAAIPKSAKAEAAQDKSPATGDQPPQIVAAKEPTELIWTQGAPDLRPVTNNLLTVHNTESNILFEINLKAYYILLSGRWYSSASLSGPWTFVKPSNLPASFNTIPPKSEKGPVRASVPGTDEAMDAIMDTQIPQTAAIRRGVANDVRVNYDGAPQFKPVEKTSLQYAVNTGQEVLKAGDGYYLCQEGIWYVSDGPDGPWTVSDVRPAGVEDIPPSNPLYNTKYVDVYAVTDEVVYEGYTEGYEGAYPYEDTVVYGTGWDYPGWVGDYYYPWSWTWGWGAAYNPWYGWGYRAGFGWGFAWGFAWGAALSHWGWGGGCWHGGGYYGGNLNIGNINIGKGNRPERGQGDRPGGPAGNRPNQPPANRNRYTGGENASRLATSDQRAKARQEVANTPRVSNRANNVYASRDGGVYRQQENGNWQQRGQNRWTDADLASPGTRDTRGYTPGKTVESPKPGAADTVRDFGNMPSANRPDRGDRSYGGDHAADLNRESAARQRGAEQTRNFDRGDSGGGRAVSSGGGGRGGRGGRGGGRR
jgi:hypothetical protein